MHLNARYFDGNTSAAHSAEVFLQSEGQIAITVEGNTHHWQLDNVVISERIGNTLRRIRHTDGAMCETADNDTLDRWLAAQSRHRLSRSIAWLEDRWTWALVALLCVIAVGWSTIRYGVPALAERAAMHLPVAIDNHLGHETMQLLDEHLFEPSTLDPQRQAEVRQRFQRIIAGLPDASRYRLEFRQGGTRIGPNAFALPSGTVVITDELIALSGHPNEITAVLAHEVGHVVNRHSTRMLLQSSASALLMFAVFGDVSSVSTLAASAPVVLVQAGYSRAFEIEADDYAYGWLRRHDIPTHYFGDLLTRLEKEHGGSGAMSYFSSHPQVEERIRN